MNWAAIALSVGLIIIGAMVHWIGSVLFDRWKQREHVPLDLTHLTLKVEALEAARREDRETLKTINAAVQDVREMFQFIRGKLNGEQWTKQGGHGYWMKDK